MTTIRWIETTPDHPWQERTVSPLPAVRDTLELTGATGQTIEGFGGCFNELGWIALGKLSASARAEVLDALFDPAGPLRFNICRLPIGASDYAAEWYSHNETPGDYEMAHFSIARDRDYLIPYIREAQRRRPDLALFASPWSPPTWMKFPRAYNHGTMVWEPRNLRAYALYFLKFVQAYAEEGLPIQQVHVQNEPVSDQKFPSCVWTGEQMREFIADYLGPLFADHGMPAEIWLGTINAPETDARWPWTTYDHYANLVLSDPKAYQYVSGVGYQWAGKYAVQQTAQSWPEKRLMQTENECGDGRNTWEYARYVFNLFRHYLSNGANAYIYWNMILEPGGNSTWGWQQNAMITADPATGEVIYNPEFHVMRHYAGFIRPGAQRLLTRGHLTGNATAYRNPDGSTVIVVSNGFPHPRSFTYRGDGVEFTAELAAHAFATFVLEG